MPIPRSRLLLCFLAITGSLAAQPASSTFRTSLLESVSIGYSYSSREDLSYGERVGDVAVQRFDFSLSGRRPWKEIVTLAYGFAYADNQLQIKGGILIGIWDEAELAAIRRRIGISS